MDFSGFGGFSIAIIAGLLLFHFVPNWVHGSSEVEATAEAITKAPKTKSSRLSQTRRIASVVSVISFSVSIVLLFFATVNPLAWLAFAISAPLFLISSALTFSAARALRFSKSSVTKRTNRRLSFETQPLIARETPTVINPRSWTPNTLPTPLLNKVGELRRVAPVVSFESVKAEAENLEQPKTDVDVLEILRRRRAN